MWYLGGEHEEFEFREEDVVWRVFLSFSFPHVFLFWYKLTGQIWRWNDFDSGICERKKITNCVISFCFFFFLNFFFFLFALCEISKPKRNTPPPYAFLFLFLFFSFFFLWCTVLSFKTRYSFFFCYIYGLLYIFRNPKLHQVQKLKSMKLLI